VKIKNLAAVITQQKKKLSFYNIDIPKTPKGYVLVKMQYSGICHTQLNEISGILGKDKFLPHCMGHEGVGKIITLGPDVNKFKKGDNVVISWVKKKVRKKILPVSYFYHGTKINTGGCNTLINYSLVSEDRLFKISKKNIYLRESIFLGCAIPTATSAIFYNSKDLKFSRVLVMGMGGLGYASLFVLNFLKCKDIICIDSNMQRLNFLKNNKNCKFLHMNNKKLKDFIKENHEKFDLIIDCTGSKSLIESTFSLVKKFTGKFILIGNTKFKEKISIKAWDIIFGKTLTGAWGQGGAIMKNFSLNEKIFLNQIINIKKILPKKNYSIKKVNDAIKDFKEGKVLRPIIKF
jgi:Zn-dependent alcohol dehydrogenase